MSSKSHFLTNEQIAELFREVAAAYEVKDQGFFQQRAYDNAAESIDHTATSLYDLWQQDALDTVPGLGDKFMGYLDELFRTGKVEHFRAAKKGIPDGFFALLPLKSVGPQRAMDLAQHLDLNDRKTALADLREHAQAHAIRELTGFGEDLEAKILDAIDEYEEHAADRGRMLLSEAMDLSHGIVEYLRQSVAVLDVEVMGSLRRRAATVGDIDIAVKTENPRAVMEHLRAFDQIRKVLSTGETTTMFLHKSGRQVDVKTEPPASWGSLLQHYTGSKAHNIALRTLAKKQNLSVSEHGIKDADGTIHPKATEADVYQTLGLAYIPPELREDRGELALAANHRLPDLITLDDIKGDFHVHTDIEIATSHDSSSTPLDQLLEAAMRKNYEYIGFSDHNPRQANIEFDEKKSVLTKRNQSIRDTVSRMQEAGASLPQVCLGLEIDIRPDGSLALEEELLEELDYAIVSIHSQFDQSRAEATKRVLTALDHPKAKIWGHPTGRHIMKRQGVEFEWQEILAFCREHDKWIEVNGSPTRLDLPDELIPQVLESGVKLVLNTDAHHVDHLDFMEFVVSVARRGGATAGDVANAKVTPLGL